MATKSFGRRGAPPRLAAPLPQPAAAVAPAAERDQPAADLDDAFRGRNLLADIPFLTAGLILFLLIVFSVETRLAFDIGRDGKLSLLSLVAFGAVSRNLVVGSGEWWRIGLAPLLHASTMHLVGNCVALFFVGWRLEPMIGRGWFALIFVVSAVGGVAGSLYGNPPGLASVGASGAITGLIAALFVVSFHHRADPDEQRAMRRTSLRFGVPALLPLFVGASGQVDYFAHAGGAIAGGATALALCALWSADRLRPDFARLAAAAAVTGLVGAMACAGFTVGRYAGYAARAAQFIPTAEMPATLNAGAAQSADLVARYPKDPRSHLVRAAYFAEHYQDADAEQQLRITLNLTSSDPAARPIREQAQIILAVVLVQQGRSAEAKTLAADACRAEDRYGVKGVLVKAKLCE